jgi:Arc/MetJ family transcription regulator
MRTNIDIDDKLMKAAMKATGANTKRAAVEACLRTLIEVHAREAARERLFRKQERERKAAMREGRLEEWYAELLKNGNTMEAENLAHQHSN